MKLRGSGSRRRGIAVSGGAYAAFRPVRQDLGSRGGGLVFD
jgi:hypothetical protein